MKSSLVLAITFKYIYNHHGSFVLRGKYGWFFGEMMLIWKGKKIRIEKVYT